VAQQHCAECHSQTAGVESPLHDAPPFPTLYQRFPVEQIGDRIEGGMMVGHPRMPLLRALDPDEERALTAYLVSFRQ
jgi:cytochrome c